MNQSSPSRSVTGSERQPAIDWLKALAVVAVITTHAGTAAFPGTPGYTWWDSVFRHLLTDFHVPCLLMISGFLYHRSQPVGLAEVGRRLERILLPYLVASLVVFAVMPSQAPSSAKAMAVALLGANALGIYYYVFLLVLFVAMLPLFSRLPLRILQATVGLLLLALAAMCVFPQLRLSLDFFWSMRNPVESFTLGYFLLGWIAAAERHRPLRWSSKTDLAIVLLAASAWPVCVELGSPYPTILLAKIPYAVLVWKLAWRFLNSRPAPALIQSTSDATYGIFLYHFLAQEPLRYQIADWPPPLRIAILTAVGLSGGLLFGEAVRRVVGPRVARRLFGY